MEGWRPENAEDAVLSACSTLISIIEFQQWKIVHFSVKEFMTSDRLQTANVGNLCRYHIPLDAAHITLARACRAVLLQLGETVVIRRIAGFPLAFYSARHWEDHSKYDETRPEVRGVIEELLDPRMPYLAAWTFICDVEAAWYENAASINDLEDPEPLPRISLNYAAVYGFKVLTEYLITTLGQDINSNIAYNGTPLHAASDGGHIDTVRVLLDHGADVNADRFGYRPLYSACYRGHVEIARLLLEHGSPLDGSNGLQALFAACRIRRVEAVRLLLQYNVDVNASDEARWTALHWATATNCPEVIELLLEYGANVNARNADNDTPLYIASRDGALESVQTLLRHGADVHIRGGDENWTPFRVATSYEHSEVARLLLEHGAIEEEVGVSTIRYE